MHLGSVVCIGRTRARRQQASPIRVSPASSAFFRARSRGTVVRMPHCTVRYSVRLTPRTPGVMAMDAVGIFHEERAEDEVGLPGELVWRRLETFSGPTGYALKEQVREQLWEMDVCTRVGPLEWDG